MDPKFIDLAEVLEIHEDQIKRYGGSPGIRDLGALESALAMPQSGIGGQYFHADLYEMAAAYLYHLVMGHPFIDGNKRVGTVTALVFLRLNGVHLDVTNPTLADTVLTVTEGRLSKPGLAEWFLKKADSSD